ncbi:carbonyl reductase [NADPH] 3-like [Anoplophora glabripennis]|uniref:carbonyl reductase [NADPH] 3-like n=1 Tax=Anoplophora glabripennis TaxID=217634 RepID=UPI000C76EE00|nr:carbonyl reductase [NADPH] 3-like [Anoplophora glabripennis]
MPTEKIAVVTGANKGIGFAIVKGLCERFQGSVYLTSRNEERGKAAVAKLKELGFNPLYHQLDIANQTSVDNFKEHIRTAHGGLDLLINNAAIGYQLTDPPQPAAELARLAENILNINYYGTKRICEALFPLLRNNAKVVNVSSSAGHPSRIPLASLRAKFTNRDLTVPQLEQLVQKFLSDARDNKTEQEGWGKLPGCAYRISKTAVTAFTNIQQKSFDKEVPHRNISINSVHPGWIKTDLNDQGIQTVEQGARGPLYLALDAELKGKYVWLDCSVVDWYGDTTPPKPTA